MAYASLEAAAHVPPCDYSFDVSCAWGCNHCGKTVWASLQDYKDAKARLADLAMRVALKKNMSCNLPCYKRDTCNMRWHLVAIFGAVGRVFSKTCTHD
eukprot:6208800-Pleurochrysis_carterae.AAC.1